MKTASSITALAAAALAAGTVAAANFTAVRNGAWTDAETWGGAGTPTLADDVSIGGFTVTNALPVSLSAKSLTLTGAAKKTLTSVTVPAKAKIGGYSYKVTAVGAKALKGQTKMTKLVIGTNVTSIGKQACYGDKKLKKVTVKTKKLKSVGAKAFDGIHKKAVFKVPAAKKAAYKKLFKGKTVK